MIRRRTAGLICFFIALFMYAAGIAVSTAYDASACRRLEKAANIDLTYSLRYGCILQEDQ